MSAVELDSIEAVVTRRQRLKREIAAAEEEVKVLDERIKAAWGDAEEATIGGQPAGTWREVTSTRLDQSTVKEYLADRGILEEFYTKSTSRVFRLTWEPPEDETAAAPEQESDF